MVTIVPPAVEPLLGLTPVTLGLAAVDPLFVPMSVTVVLPLFELTPDAVGCS
jgi:hypothetical protein